MIKAIIVDDELITRKGLIDYIDWNSLDVEIAGEASDGLEALEVARETHPDMVLCDVRMPRMDGINFTKNLLELYPQCKVIFLSGYSDVNYLKSAIQLKAVDYILKPINIEELLLLIKKTVLLCYEEKKKAIEEKEMIDKIEQSIPYLTQRLLNDLISGVVDTKKAFAEKLKFIKKDFTIKGLYICVVLSAESKSLQKQAGTIFTLLAEELGLSYISGDLGQDYSAVFSYMNEEERQAIMECINETIKTVRVQLKTNISAGLGEACNDVAQISYSYKQAVKALNHQFFYGTDVVIQYSSIQNVSTPLFIFDKQKFHEFEDSLKKMEFHEAIKIIDEVVKDLKVNSLVSIEEVRKQLFRLYIKISAIFPEAALDFENNKLWAKVFMVDELDKIRNFIVNLLSYLEEDIRKIGNNTEKSIIKNIENYIQTNYSKDISINTIAGEVYLTPTYLCLLFKKEKGITINEYITAVRIENSKKLLKDRSLKLYDVAYKVGYGDPNYFARVFRKIVGLNPSDYRDSL